MSEGIPGLPPSPERPGPLVLTLGSFDGVHRGHLQLLRWLQLEAIRREAAPVALTFDPHPRCIVDPAGCPAMLTSVEERLALLRQAGGGEAHAVAFDRRLSRWSATRFVRALLDWAPMRALVVGPGFALGHRREGDLAFLEELGRRWGFAVVSVPPLCRRAEPVSSSRIRQALAGGRVREAATMLGRDYMVEGRVVSGRGRGRRLGFPTANLAVPAGRCIPAAGVYATRVGIGGAWLPAATSIGTNPTFGDGSVSIEPHLIDWDGDLRDRPLRLAFVRRLRSQRRYAKEATLIAQIGRDVDRVRRLLR